jgi:formate hydrogenlyase subunit 3/multisubunit Na+/H+ antiporter MnhD subunit
MASATVWLTGVILLPFLVGILVLLIPRRIGYKAPLIQRVIPLITAGIATVCALPLITFEREVYLPITWLPGTGAMTLHIGGVGSYATLVTTAALFAVQWHVRASDSTFSDNKGNIREDDKSRHIHGVLLIALAATNASFLAGHFLGRYVALEAVGLCIALLPLLELRNRSGMRLSQSVYLTLRLGDAGLLVAILMLMDASGTLNIEEALHTGETLGRGHLAWVVAGFVLAVWVKTGAWPFHRWQQAGHRLSPVGRAWLYGLVMPNLGLYLLYRVTPLLMLNAPMRIVVFSLGGGSILVSAALMARGKMDDGAGRSLVVASGLNTILAGVGLVLAAGGATSLLVWLLLLGTPLRLWSWLRSAAPSYLEPEGIERRLFRVARATRRGVETGLLEQGMIWTTRGVVNGAKLLHRIVEQEGLEGLLRVTAHGVLAMSHWMQRCHTGRLRVNLVWVVISLIGMVAMLAIKGW